MSIQRKVVIVLPVMTICDEGSATEFLFATRANENEFS